MARYFLHVRTPGGLAPDGEGVELARLGDLHREVVKVAADLIGGDPAAADWRFEVADEMGRTVLSERLGALVPRPAASS
ncbi:MAG TPA: hypothetical protein VND97_01300 [Beijerinckiaceae bacterium]|nr:hypothetical protein [Beijerinckiaceae bacterium]